MDRRSVRARTRLIDAAESIIATKGVDALTLSEVQQIAGQRNKSAIAYHFGSRDDLVRAVVRRQIDVMDTRRRERIEKISAPLKSLSRVELLHLLLCPILDGVFEAPTSYEARCLQQFGSQHELVEMMVSIAAESNSQMIRGLLMSDLDHLPQALAATRIDYAMILVITLLARFETCRDLGIVSALPNAVVRRDLIQVANGIISLPADPMDADPRTWATRYTRTFRFDPLECQ